jgi:hypothetical protein
LVVGFRVDEEEDFFAVPLHGQPIVVVAGETIVGVRDEFAVRGSRFGVRGSRFKVRGSPFAVRRSRFKLR